MKDDEKKFALVLELSGPILDSSNLAMKILSETCSISYIYNNSLLPHVTIDSGFNILDTRKFQLALALTLDNCPKFVLRSKGLGIFVEQTPVIHIRWIVNEALNILRSEICECLVDLQIEGVVSGYRVDLDWLPKTTLAFRDTSYDTLQPVLNSIQHISFLESFQVNTLSTYGYSLKDGESRMGDIQFKA